MTLHFGPNIDAQHRQRVEEALKVIRFHRSESDDCLQRRLGYREGYGRGFILGVLLTLSAGVAVGVWLWLSGAVN